MTTAKHYFWNTTGYNQGQIIEVREPQVAGAAEGFEGAAKGITLAVDHSDKSWTLRKNGKEYANGKGSDTIPTVEQAMSLWKNR